MQYIERAIVERLDVDRDAVFRDCIRRILRAGADVFGDESKVCDLMLQASQGNRSAQETLAGGVPIGNVAWIEPGRAMRLAKALASVLGILADRDENYLRDEDLAVLEEELDRAGMSEDKIADYFEKWKG